MLTDIVAAIGGYLGLFIGLSCLSLYDLLCQFVGTIYVTMTYDFDYLNQSGQFVPIHFCSSLNNGWFNFSNHTPML